MAMLNLVGSSTKFRAFAEGRRAEWKPTSEMNSDYGIHGIHGILAIHGRETAIYRRCYLFS
jgi:hypothetical protein